MDARTGIVDTLFSFRGRVGRPVFAGGVLAIGVAALALVYVSVLFAGTDSGLLGGGVSAVLFLVALVALWPLAALLCRRLRDSDRSPWHAVWLAAFWVVPSELISEPAETFLDMSKLVLLVGLAAWPGSTQPQASP